MQYSWITIELGQSGLDQLAVHEKIKVPHYAQNVLSLN